MKSIEQARSQKIIASEANKSIRNLITWIAGFIILAFIIPIILIFSLPADKRYVGFAVLGAVPFMEYLAISIGIGLGINPIISFLLTWLPCTGLAMLVLGLLEFLKDSSKRTRGFLEKAQTKITKYPKVKKYGIFGNFLFVMFLGVYIAPGVSVIMGWSKGKSLILMSLGIAFIAGMIGLGTTGIIDLFFL